MKTSQISVRLPYLELERLRIEARADGLSIASVIRRRLEAATLGQKIEEAAQDLRDRIAILELEIQRGRMQ